MDIQGYVNKIRDLYKSGHTTEHSFRPALAELFASIDPSLTVINEPKRLIDVGAPDFVFVRNGISIGWCEAKDIAKDVRKFATGDYSKDQKSRYAKGLPNLVYTNGLDFEFIRDGETYSFVTIADILMGITERPDNFGVLERLLQDFAAQTPVSITTAKQLASMMAGKAAIIKDIMGRALQADIDAIKSTELTDQYDGFQASLIHDITVGEFADIYAETIAYGLFAARLHDTTQNTFSRAEALELLPKSNPFLRNLFVYIAGPFLDDRLVRMVDDLCDIFKATSLHDLLKDFGKFTARNDPFIHFYETFLGEYNPAKRKARGVWYTPEPVVNFIVRAVDDVLKTEFGLADGLADTSKVTVDWDTGQTEKGKPVIIKKDVHRVQVLDPATGTGTFLAEVIKLVSGRVKGIAPGQWSSYVEQDLIPRLHGFELLMASYAMCHMKLDMMLTERGYKPSSVPPRLSVYLTNSLEEGERVEQTLQFARWVSEEAKGANTIKRDQPIMCVVGNPPYSVASQNQSSWIQEKISDHKTGLDETKINLDDNYIKFLRFSQWLVEKNGTGVCAMITNNSFIDGITHRIMRKNMISCYDKIYILDLHGSSMKLETAPDGGRDQNVFDIMQGVSIGIFVKSGKENSETKIFHADLWGPREAKYESLWASEVSSLFSEIYPSDPYYFFVPKDETGKEVYSEGFSVRELFGQIGSGVKNERDAVCIKFAAEEIRQIVEFFKDNDPEEIRTYLKLGKDSRDWTVAGAKADVMSGNGRITPVLYRPFDIRSTFYIGKSRGFSGTPGGQRMRQMTLPNLALLTCRQQSTFDFSHVMTTEFLSDICSLSSQTKETGYCGSLYLHPEDGTLDTTIRVNFDPKIYAQIRAAAGLSGPLVAPDGTDTFRTATGEARPDEVKVFDYIYCVLHAPAYRETYREFLKIDFPRVPYPSSPDIFRRISEQGEALRRLHLMEDAAIGDTPFPFEGEGDSVVDKPRLEDGKVWINATQAFAGVSQTAWDFQIGGYQPAQKWLKDRKGRQLSWDDIRHYQKIIKILGETDRIMQEIDLPLDVAGDQEMAA